MTPFSQTERIETGKNLIESIMRDARSREEAWHFVSRNWLPDFANTIIEAGWSARDAERGMSIVILRVHRLLGIRIAGLKPYVAKRREKVKRRLNGSFYDFLEKGIFDAILMTDLKDNDGQKALPYMKEQWRDGIRQKLYEYVDASLEAFEESAMIAFQHRVSQNCISLKEYPLRDYLFDEYLIVMIESGKNTANRVFHYIRTHWYEYLTSVIPKHEHERDELCTITFNQVMVDFWKRVTQPQKGERLFLRDRLKTYLYSCMRNKYPDQKKEIKETAADNHPTKEFIQTDLLLALELEEGPSMALSVKDTGADSITGRWASLAPTHAERRVAIEHLTPGCKQLFELDAEGLHDAKIAGILNFTSINYVKNKRYKCNAKIEAFIQKLRGHKK